MSSVESARHALYSELERVLGSEHARTLMNHLPQHPSDEAATRGDLEGLERRMEPRFQGMEGRFDRMEGRFDRMEDRFDRMEERFDRMEERFEDRFERLAERIDRMQRFYVGTTVGSMTALTAIFTLALGFFR